MAKGLKRYQGFGHRHYLTFSCYRRQPFLATEDARETFVATLERVRQKYDFTIYAHVVMPEHVHLLVSEPPELPLMRAIQSLKISSSKRRPESPFWQRRYYDFNVWSAPKHMEKVRYIHRNPVRRGLVAKPGEWQWSSFNAWLSRTSFAVKIADFPFSEAGSSNGTPT